MALNLLALTWVNGMRNRSSTLHWIQPGKPNQNVYIEHFNCSFRRELLDAHLFRSLIHVRQLVEKWMLDYNMQRP
jgi:putative transposase